MKVISDIKAKPKSLIIAIGEDIATAVPSKENPEYSQKFWDEVQEALKEAEAEFGTLKTISYEEARRELSSRVKFEKVASND